MSQVVGGLIAGGLIFVVAQGKDGFEATGSMAANGYGAHSPDGYGLLSALIIEIVLTAIFVWVILGTTDLRAPAGFAPAAIGLTLTIIHLIAIPITNTSVNPARSTAVAFYNGAGAPSQLWLFWVAPIVGAVIAGILYGPLFGGRTRYSRPDGRYDAYGPVPATRARWRSISPTDPPSFRLYGQRLDSPRCVRPSSLSTIPGWSSGREVGWAEFPGVPVVRPVSPPASGPRGSSTLA